MDKTNTIKELFDRKSVRVYTDREITETEKALIIESAIQAPTAGNMALYSIIDVTSPEEKMSLSRLCDNQPFIAIAPMVLIFVADYEKWYRGFCRVAGDNIRRPKEGDMLLAFSDALIAAQNAVVAAESLGIGSCYIGDIIEHGEDVAKLLELPQYTAPAAMLCFGFPTKQQKEREKPTRFDKKHICFENKYHIMDEKGQDEMFLCQGGAKKTFSAYYKRKWETPFIYEMSRSAKMWIERWCKED